MKHRLFSIFFFALFTSAQLTAQEQTYYRTATSYASFKWDKLPFSMPTVKLVVAKDGSLKVADVVFEKSATNIYQTTDKKGYLVFSENNAFIVTPDGVEWTCYYANKERIKEVTAFPDYSGQDEMVKLKEAIQKIYSLTASKTENKYPIFYLAASTFKNSANIADKIPASRLSADTMLVNKKYYFKKMDKLYLDKSESCLYMLDNGDFIIQEDIHGTVYYAYYTTTEAQASQLIAQNFSAQNESDKIKELTSQLDKISENNYLTNQVKVINNYIKGNPSQRNDPALEKIVANWWRENQKDRSAIKKIFIIEPNYDVVKKFEIIERKQIDVIVTYKYSDGKCYAQWRSFGYQYMGGGTYDKDLNSWVSHSTTGTFVHAIRDSATGKDVPMDAGSDYEINCDVIK